MYLFVVSVHVLLCLLLIGAILLQPGKGGMGGAFGGGGNAFGPRGQASLLSRLTTAVAVMFMVTSVSLAYYSDRGLREGVDVDDALEQLQRSGQGTGSGSAEAPVAIPAPVESAEVVPLGAGSGSPAGDASVSGSGSAVVEE